MPNVCLQMKEFYFKRSNNKVVIFFIISGMLGYGMAKAAVHQLVKGLAEEKGGLPPSASVLAILP